LFWGFALKKKNKCLNCFETINLYEK